MVGMKKKLMAVAVALVVSAGTLAMPQKNDKRPPKPKDAPKVVVEPKGDKTPPNSNQENKGKGDKKGKP